MTSDVTIALVGCVKAKLDCAAPAQDLYTSPLFLGRRRWVEARGYRWFVISAEHGLVAPEAVLAPYDYTLKGRPVAVKRAWAARVLAQLDIALGNVDGMSFEVHAGHAYLGFGLVDGLISRGAHVHNPVEGLGLGKQLQLYARSKR